MILDQTLNKSKVISTNSNIDQQRKGEVDRSNSWATNQNLYQKMKFVITPTQLNLTWWVRPHHHHNPPTHTNSMSAISQLLLTRLSLNLDERHLLMKYDLWWKTTFDGRWPLTEVDLWLMTTFDGRWPLIED